MLVEDNLDLREAVADTLSDAGYLVMLARNGEDAMAALRAEPVDVVLLDLMMPVMDGWALHEAIAREPALSKIPIIVLSAHTTSEPFEGASAHLRKPIQREALLDAIRAVLPTRT